MPCSECQVSVAGGTVTVSHDAGRVGDEKIRHRILDLGYRRGSYARIPEYKRGGRCFEVLSSKGLT
jgi:hypothetical protein